MNVPSRKELIAAGYPFGKVAEGLPLGDPSVEWARTKPDVKVYIPERDLADDCDNCVLAVLPTFSGDELLAIWTQSACEGHGNNRIVIARSRDGVAWDKPALVVGTRETGGMQSSWGMPMYTRRGRLYVFYIQETDHPDPGVARVYSGELALIYSDDDGHTWSKPGVAPLPRCRYDNPDARYTKNWWCFQAPIRDAEGKFVVGFTINFSEAVKTLRLHYPHQESQAAFLTFENLDDHPKPEDVRVSIAPQDGLFVPNKLFPEMSVAQEPAPVLLPDGRLFATMRTMAGCVYYTVRDEGGIWREAKPLIGHDSKPVMHALAPCPTYRLDDGRFICFATENPGERNGYTLFTEAPTLATAVTRNPVYMLVGEYAPSAEQPIRFGKPQLFFDTDDVAVGELKRSSCVSCYTAVTQWRGKTIIWYPDRKYYILGKEITPAFLDAATPGIA